MTLKVPQPASGHPPYRADIDGLRAIAVLGVVFYHFGLPWTGGGYVGVDVFFVISGFLIGRSIIADIRARRFSLLGFYERRIRRLYPALMVMIVAIMPIFHLLMLPTDLRSFGRSLVAALFYGSNIAFYWERGYFDAGAETKPLLHTWSLSVEEQFYLVFPLLVWLVVRWRPAALAPVLVLLALVSLAAAEMTLGSNPTAVFYLFPYRAWEMVIGVALTFLIDAPRATWLDRHGELLGGAGLVLVLLPIVTYTHATPFPALAALPPCLGSALLLLSGAGGRYATANRILSTPALRFVGLISYSLYLWHWPVLVALGYYLVHPLSPAWSAFGVGLSVVVATLSWRFVEVPIRSSRSIGRRTLFVSAAAATAIFAAIGFFYYHTDGFPSRFNGPDAAMVAAADDFLQHGGTCFDEADSDIKGLAYCRLGDADAKPSFLVWADSHGRAWRDGIDQLARERHLSGLLVWRGGCPPLFGTGKDELVNTAQDNQLCLIQNERLKQLLISDRELRTVILIGRWSYYTSGTGTGADQANRIRLTDAVGRQVNFAEQAQATVAWLRGSGRRVFVAEQVPEIPFANARQIAQKVLAGQMTLARALERYAYVPRSTVERRQASAATLFSELARNGEITLLRTHGLLCDHVSCSSWRDGRPILFDNNHLTVAASIRLRHVFDQALTPRAATPDPVGVEGRR